MRANGQGTASREPDEARTLTETVRRAQIVAAAIETIAEVGYARASYARIARRAALSSTGMISYHFAGKAELMEQVVAAVVRAGQAFMQPRIQTAAPGSARLRAYIESNLAFMATHRSHMAAVAEVIGATSREREGSSAPYAPRHAAGLSQLEGYLREGQDCGELRDFTLRVMAETIRAAIDAIAFRLPTEPELDLAGYGHELADLFEHATRRTPPRDGTRKV